MSNLNENLKDALIGMRLSKKESEMIKGGAAVGSVANTANVVVALPWCPGGACDACITTSCKDCITTQCKTCTSANCVTRDKDTGKVISTFSTATTVGILS